MQPAGPYRLGGNCNGGLVAFEMARRLEQKGEQVERLLLVRASGRTIHLRLADRLARGIAASGILKGGGDHPAWRRKLLEFAEVWDRRSAGGRVRLLGEKLVGLPRLIRRSRPSDRPDTGSLADTGLGGRRERLRDAYMRAAREYVPGSYSGKVSLLWPDQDGESPDEARSWWLKVADSVKLQVLPGDHLSYSTVHVEEFARRLARELE
jgi:thioesterase domain-containing protein